MITFLNTHFWVFIIFGEIWQVLTINFIYKVNLKRYDNKVYHTSNDFSLYKSLLLKLAKSLTNDLSPCVLVEKTNTQL